MRVGVLTISDSVAKGEREDRSGPAVVAACRGLGWEVTVASQISDDPAGIREQLRSLADSGRVDVLLTTGGTGLGRGASARRRAASAFFAAARLDFNDAPAARGPWSRGRSPAA